MHHEMLLTDAQEGIWECPVCPRIIILRRDLFRVLVKGDLGVSHMGASVPGLMLGPSEVG
jgi:hypothetical protein